MLMLQQVLLDSSVDKQHHLGLVKVFLHGLDVNPFREQLRHLRYSWRVRLIIRHGEMLAVKARTGRSGLRLSDRFVFLGFARCFCVSVRPAGPASMTVCLRSFLLMIMAGICVTPVYI